VCDRACGGAKIGPANIYSAHEAASCSVPKAKTLSASCTPSPVQRLDVHHLPARQRCDFRSHRGCWTVHHCVGLYLSLHLLLSFSIRSDWRRTIFLRGSNEDYTLTMRAQPPDNPAKPVISVCTIILICILRSDWTRTIFLRGSDEDYTLTTRARLLERIRVTLAGRAAEEALLPGGATTYSTGDLKVGSVILIPYNSHTLIILAPWGRHHLLHWRTQGAAFMHLTNNYKMNSARGVEFFVCASVCQGGAAVWRRHHLPATSNGISHLKPYTRGALTSSCCRAAPPPTPLAT